MSVRAMVPVPPLVMGTALYAWACTSARDIVDTNGCGGSGFCSP